MKNSGNKIIAFCIGISIFTTILTVVVMRQIYKGSELSARDSGNARLASYTDLMLDDKVRRSYISSAPTNFIAAAEAITPSVVNIKAITKGNGESFWEDGHLSASNGSGVIISGDGYIVTNNHVVQDATDIQITMDDKREFSAKIIGKDAYTDVAVLKIDAINMSAVRFGNSDSIRVGEWVLAVGNPFNLSSTVTAGIVSAKARSINILDDDKYAIEAFIQTDAAVNPGNSGGALVNTNGELVGINTAIITKSGRYEGYSFAIPANLVLKVVRDIMKFGIVQRGFLGVVINDLTPSLSRTMGYTSMNGVYVEQVNPKSAASEAGLKHGDIIISVQNKIIKNKAELLELVAEQKPGDKIVIDYFRAGQMLHTQVTLKNKDNTTGLVQPENPDESYDIFKRIGMTDVRELTNQESRKLSVKGIKVVGIERGSQIDRTNMEIGFILTRINDTKVESVEQAAALIKKLHGQILLEGVYEDFPDNYFYKIVK